MAKDRIGIAGAGLLACVVAVLAGCPSLPTSAFNASGEYSGAWTTTGDAAVTCPFTMTLVHAPGLPLAAGFAVVGLVEFPYDCILPEELLNEILDDLPDLIVPITGEMSDTTTGQITLSVNTETFDLPFSLELTFDGDGQDTDGDGVMNDYSGTLSLTLTIETNVQGFEQVTVPLVGSFVVTRTS